MINKNNNELLNAVKSRMGILSNDIDEELLRHIKVVKQLLLFKFPKAYDEDDEIIKSLITEKTIYRFKELNENQSTVIIDCIAYAKVKEEL